MTRLQVRERAVEAALRKQVKAMGGFCVKWVPSEAGLPDRLVFLPGGRIFLVELKKMGGTLRPAQVVWHRRLADIGIEVVVLTGLHQTKIWCESVANH